MQLRNWNDLKFLLAVKTGGTLSRAGHILGVDKTTVSRRLKALQNATGKSLYLRGADGEIHLTTAGLEVAQLAEHMQASVGRIEQALGGSEGSVAGMVRVTSVPMLVNRMLAPGIANLLQAHPHLDVELIPDARDFSLTRREADIALRLARPHHGGSSVIARRLADLSYAVYAAHDVPPGRARQLPWIGYEDAMRHLPQARWMTRAAARAGNRMSGLKVHDAETALEAVIAGIGKTALPRIIADRDRRLRRLPAADGARPPTRELWLLVHRDLMEVRRVREVTGWIDRLTAGQGGSSQAA